MRRGTATVAIAGAGAGIGIITGIIGTTAADANYLNSSDIAAAAISGSPLFRLFDYRVTIVPELQLGGRFGMVRPLDSLSGATGRSRRERWTEFNN
jgi:hypothetical protein